MAHTLKISHCIIVPGNSDEDTRILEDMGHAAIKALDFLLPVGKNVVAVMGGTTMVEVAHAMDEKFGENRQLLFVPARGGLGESVDIQANVIAETMARKSGGRAGHYMCLIMFAQIPIHFCQKNLKSKKHFN